MDIKIFLKEMGLRILKARLDKAYTQEYLAELVDVSSQSISYAENGKKMMKLENFIKLCKALDISADYLLFGTENKAALSISEEDFERLTPEQRESIKQILDNCLKMCK